MQVTVGWCKSCCIKYKRWLGLLLYQIQAMGCWRCWLLIKKALNLNKLSGQRWNKKRKRNLLRESRWKDDGVEIQVRPWSNVLGCCCIKYKQWEEPVTISNTDDPCVKTWPTQSLGHVHEECLWEVIGGWYGGGQDDGRGKKPVIKARATDVYQL